MQPAASAKERRFFVEKMMSLCFERKTISEIALNPAFPKFAGTL